MGKIRKFENKDTNKVMDIWLRSTIKAHDFIDKQYWQDNYELVKNIYIPVSDTFVYDDDGTIKGFISVLENSFIGALFVDVDSQGIGIGSSLIDYAVSKYKKLELAAYKQNERAVKFYKKKGFVVTKEQPNEDSGFPEYIMEKQKA